MDNQKFEVKRKNRNIFTIYYLENPLDRKYIEYKINIPNYNEKIYYLLKRFPYPDLVKQIIKYFKFFVFQEKFVLEKVNEQLEINLEEDHLGNLIEDLMELVSQSKHIKNFEAEFHQQHAHINYEIGESYRYSTPVYPINYDPDDYYDNYYSGTETE